MQSKKNPNNKQTDTQRAINDAVEADTRDTLAAVPVYVRQIDLLLAELARIKPDITTTDRQAAIKELDYSEFTVVQYLGGKGTNLDTAAALLGFFKRRIKDRAELLVQS